MAYPAGSAALDLPAWKTAVSHVAAAALAILFLSAGLWKATDPIEWAARVAQMKVPGSIADLTAVSLGIGETFAALLLIVPRFRRWGAWLTGIMLVAFMAWVGFYYSDLTGKDCSCFPWLKRAIGPGFFIGDAVMLALALIAGVWARRSQGLRPALLALAAITVFAGASYGVMVTRQTRAPETVTVDGKAFSLHQGKILLFFFDPECSHCLASAQALSKHTWKDAQVVAIPTRVPQFTPQFMAMSGLKALVTNDLDPLNKTFPHGDPPFGVALENGYQKAQFPIFDDSQPAAKLRELGFIQ